MLAFVDGNIGYFALKDVLNVGFQWPPSGFPAVFFSGDLVCHIGNTFLEMILIQVKINKIAVYCCG